MVIFGRKSKSGFSFIRVASAVLVLALLVVVVTESAKYLHSARLPASVSTKLEPSVYRLADALGAVKASLESLNGFGSMLIKDQDRISSVNGSGDVAGASTDGSKVPMEDFTLTKVVTKIAVLADSHNDDTYLEKALIKAQDLEADRVLFLGDYTDWGELVYLQKAKEIMDAAQIPYVSLPGDHDLGETRDESNFTKVFGETYGVLALDEVKLMYFDNSKNFTKLSDSNMIWFKKEIKDTNFLFLSQPLMTDSMLRVMGIVDGVKDESVFSQNIELLELVRSSDVQVIVSGDLHQFTYFDDPVETDLRHYSVGAVLKSQSLEKLNLQLPRFAVLTIKDDLSYEVRDIPID